MDKSLNLFLRRARAVRIENDRDGKANVCFYLDFSLADELKAV